MQPVYSNHCHYGKTHRTRQQPHQAKQKMGQNTHLIKMDTLLFKAFSYRFAYANAIGQLPGLLEGNGIISDD